MALTLQQIERIFNQRKSLTDSFIRGIIPLLFSSALENAAIADYIANQQNRITQQFATALGKEKIQEFAAKYPHLKANMHKNWNLPADNRLHFKIPPIANSLDGKTRAAVLNNPLVHRDAQNKLIEVEYNGNRYPIVTRKTRDFNQILFSAGTQVREIIKLDPNSERLKSTYDKLKKYIDYAHHSTTQEILLAVGALSRIVFPSTDIDAFIAQQLHDGHLFIGLDTLMEKGIGVCRHHALLNAYLLSRLIEDGVIKGEVIHHRQEIKGGSHTWNLFIDQSSGKTYSLDSLWSAVINLSDNPGALDKLYGAGVEATINQRFPPQGPSSENAQPQKDVAANPIDKINEPPIEASPLQKQNDDSVNTFEIIREYIEKTPFTVGGFLFYRGGLNITLPEGEIKRVPHRVAAIYLAIGQRDNKSDDDLLAEVKQLAQSALDNPRAGQTSKTRAFYRGIINDSLPTLEPEAACRKIV